MIAMNRAVAIVAIMMMMILHSARFVGDKLVIQSSVLRKQRKKFVSSAARGNLDSFGFEQVSSSSTRRAMQFVRHHRRNVIASTAAFWLERFLQDLRNSIRACPSTVA